MIVKLYIVFGVLITWSGWGQNLIQPLTPDKGKSLQNWQFAQNGEKASSKFFEGLKWSGTGDQPELTAEWTSPKALTLIADLLKPVSNNDLLEFRFDLQIQNPKSLRYVKCRVGDGSVENVVFELSKEHVDTCKALKWYEIVFRFRPACNFDVSTIHTEFFGLSSGGIAIRNVSLSKKPSPLDENLIQNGGFEEIYFFPTKEDFIYWNVLAAWNDKSCSEPPLASSLTIEVGSDFGFMNIILNSVYSLMSDKCTRPFEGRFCAKLPNGYMYDEKRVDLNTVYNECYLQSELKETLTKDSVYLFEFYIALDSRSEWADNSLGVKFTEGFYDPNSEVDFHAKERKLPTADIVFFDDPVTSTEWIKLSFEYHAKGNEKNVCIGVFQNPKHAKKVVTPKVNTKNVVYTSVYHIDCVSLRPR